MPEQFEGIASKTFQPGEVIFRQGGAPSGEAYLVHDGAVEVRRRVGGKDRLLRTLTQGHLLGEVSLFQEAQHSATAVATERSTLLVIPAARLESMVRAHPELAIALIRQLARMVAGAEEAGRSRRDR
jgi:CRP-like cAMP-binding protein